MTERMKAWEAATKALEAYDTYFGDGEGEVHPNCDCDNCKTAHRIIAEGKTALALMDTEGKPIAQPYRDREAAYQDEMRRA